MSERVKAGCVAAFLWVAALSLRAEDFPSVRDFGPYFEITGGDLVQTPRLMGPTGVVGWIHGREFVVHEVEKGSPAEGILRPGDVVLKANGHGLGRDARMGLGTAITEAEAADGRLRLAIYRDGKELDVTVPLQKLGPYSATWPFECAKSRRAFGLFSDYLAREQDAEGGFGFRVAGAANGLVLLANPDPRYLESCRRLAYHFLRDRASMGGLGTWDTSYTGIYLAEYYLVTGDRAVLPELERVCKILAEGQQPCGSWGHGATINRYYAIGGLLNQCGLTAWIALILGQRAGVAVDARAIDRATRFFATFADRGNVPYGDHIPWDGTTGNGKDATACIAFALLGDPARSRLFADQMAAYYPHMEEGHTGPYFAFLWHPVAALRATRRADFQRLMDYWAWYYDLGRSWEGGGLLLGTGDSYVPRGFRFCTAAIAMPYALPTGVERLAVMGAPRSVFGAGDYAPAIAKARQLFFQQGWVAMRGVLRTEKLTGEAERHGRQLLDAADAAQRSRDLTLAAVEDNLKRGWNPVLARRQLEDLKTFLVKEEPRVSRLLRQVEGPSSLAAVEEARKTYDKYRGLSRLDDAARKAMEPIAADRKLGYLAELARCDIEEPRGFRAIFTLEEDWDRFFGSWQKDPLAMKGFRQMATTWGGEWPTREAKKHLRAAGYLLEDKETMASWAELVPITDKEGKRGKAKAGRFLFLPREKAFDGPPGWHLPGFDDGGWKPGPFPVGTSHGDRSATIMPEGTRAVFARVHFQLDSVDFSRLRLLHRVRHLCSVYLNGHLVARILYQGNEGGYETAYEALDLHPQAAALLRQGDNVLALEGAYDLWWGIFDVGLYGQKGTRPAVQPPPPPQVTRRTAPEPDDPRFTPRDVWKERQDAMDKLPIAELVKELANDSVHLRGHAARSLAKKGKEAAPALIQALGHPHWHVRRGACEAIHFMEKDARANASEALPALSKALDDPDFYVRDGAARAIAAIGYSRITPDAAVPKLIKLLDDPDSWWPREAAVLALGGQAQGLLPALVTTLHKTTNVVTESALRHAIVRYARGDNAADVTGQVVGLIRQDSDWFRQRILLGLLKELRTGARTAVPLVEQMLKDAGGDREKQGVLQDVLKAIGGKP